MYGAYDLILHEYGPENHVGSVHVEIPDTLTADEIDLLERRLAAAVYAEHGVILAGIGIYSVNTKDDELKQLRTDVTHLISAHEGVLQIHGFYANRDTHTVSVDIILDFGLPDREAAFEAIRKELAEAFPEWSFIMTMDLDT